MNVSITQSDVITAYGHGLDALWNGLLSNETAIKPTQRFADRSFCSDQAALIEDLQVDPDGSRVMSMLRVILAPLKDKLDPMTPIILSTTVGEIEYLERAILSATPKLAEESRPQELLRRVKQFLGLRGPGILISSACASSTAALTRAASMIRRSETSKVLVVAADALSEFVYSGFSTLQSLCPEPARPFDADRCGLTLGEAAAWAILEADNAISKNPAQATILGWGNTTDAVHMTAPDRFAGGLGRAITKACEMAARSYHDVSLIAAHGTGTIYSDAMELTAFKKAFVFKIPVFSIKGAVGHTLAAAGLVQVLVASRALSQKLVPPTVGLHKPDPAAYGCAHSNAFHVRNLTDKPRLWENPPSIDHVIRGVMSISGERCGDPLALSTNSGFGGVNTAILLGAKGGT